MEDIENKILDGKLKSPGIFTIIETPQERLEKLQQLYNSMEYNYDTALTRDKCNCYMNEMNAILKLYPELSKTVKLKIYDSGF